MSFTPSKELREFLELSYAELKEFNLAMKKDQLEGKDSSYFSKKVLTFLENTKPLKAVTVAFCDLEGKLQVLDYDKDFFLDAYENLTFDGSSIAGFSELKSSDLRLGVDFGSFRILPSDIFGSGKAFVFANVHDKDGSQYESDFRGVLQLYLQEMKKKDDITYLVAPEIEGFLMKGIDAEQYFKEDSGFELATTGGYFNALPQDDLRKFIDTVAEVIRALGYENEKDHGEVAPAQFEINYKYTDALIAADQILLYKFIARQVAKLYGFTATFLPKPRAGINGSGMHANMSLMKGGKNIFYGNGGEDGLSELGQKFCHGILNRAKELNLTYCSSVNSYRRLDPNFEAPNEIKKHACDRGSVVRIPLANEKSARIEVRAVAPDSNPYLAFFVLLQAGLEGVSWSADEYKKIRSELESHIDKLYGCIQDSIEGFENSAFAKKTMGESSARKYAELKQESADRCAKMLGKTVKRPEVVFHHEVKNQVLWKEF